MANSWWCGSFPQKNTCCNKVFKWLFEGWPRGCCNSRSAGCADHLLSGPEFGVCLAFWGCEWEDLNDENWPNRWQNHHTETTFWRGIFWYCRLFWVGETVKHPELLILLYHDLWLLWCRWKLSNSRIFGPPCINSSEIMVYLSLRALKFHSHFTFSPLVQHFFCSPVAWMSPWSCPIEWHELQVQFVSLVKIQPCGKPKSKKEEEWHFSKRWSKGC